MYVISNKEGIDGAHYIFTSSDIQKQIYDIFEESFYILPSSINDTICIPQSEVHDVEMLRQIIKEVNTNEVREEEILSDSLYFYNAETEKIEIAKCSMVA